MKMQEMMTLFEYYVDDVIDTSTVVSTFNRGKDIMIQDMDVEVPDLDYSNPNDQYIFPEKFHELPLLYAAAMFKAYDSSLQEKESFLQQFYAGVQKFKTGWEIPEHLKKGDDRQVITLEEDLLTNDITITSNTYTKYGFVDVYVNGTLVPNTRYGKIISIDSSIKLMKGDIITVIWDTYHVWHRPQYTWEVGG